MENKSELFILKCFTEYKLLNGFSHISKFVTQYGNFSMQEIFDLVSIAINSDEHSDISNSFINFVKNKTLLEKLQMRMKGIEVFDEALEKDLLFSVFDAYFMANSLLSFLLED